VQVALRALGLYLGPIDGDIGPKTVKAVRAAQLRAHVPVNGVLDARTRRSLGPLGRPLPKSRVLRSGDFGLDVSAAQFLLTRHGIYVGALDGYMGPEVEAAVRRYQRRVHLAADGVIGPSTWRALARRVRVPRQPKPPGPCATTLTELCPKRSPRPPARPSTE